MENNNCDSRDSYNNHNNNNSYNNRNLAHIIKTFNQPAHHFAAVEFIFLEIAARMTERLDYIKFKPNTILDLGSGLNIDSKLLRQKFNKAQIYTLDCALNQLKHQSQQYSLLNKALNKILQKKQVYPICADAKQLPLQSQSMDLVWANLLLPYLSDMKQFFQEIRRVLTIGGTFLVSGLGVDSLVQLRQLGLKTYNFPDMHIIGDMLVGLGFTNPVVDVEYIHLEYDNLTQLLADIRLVGVGGNIPPLHNREELEFPHVHTHLHKSDYQTLEKRAETLRNNGGKLSLTLEVFYAHAWKDKIKLELPQDMHAIDFIDRRK